MFQDDTSQQAVYWESSWKTSTAKSSTAVQTSEVLTNEVETQSRHLVDCAVRPTPTDFFNFDVVCTLSASVRHLKILQLAPSIRKILRVYMNSF